MKAATAKVQLLTIVCANELEERLAADLRAFSGISGYTLTHANGRGLHGPRELGIVDGANVRIEVLMAPQLAQKVLDLLAVKYDEEPLTAYMQEVEAFPRAHFVS